MNDKSLSVITVVVSIFFPLLFPLVMWLTQRSQNHKVATVAAEVLNFQLSLLIMTIGIMTIGIMMVLGVLSFIGGLLNQGLGAYLLGADLVGLVEAVISIGYLVLMIIAAVQASKNQDYGFPLTFRFVK